MNEPRHTRRFQTYTQEFCHVSCELRHKFFLSRQTWDGRSLIVGEYDQSRMNLTPKSNEPNANRTPTERPPSITRIDIGARPTNRPVNWPVHAVRKAALGGLGAFGHIHRASSKVSNSGVFARRICQAPQSFLCVCGRCAESSFTLAHACHMRNIGRARRPVQLATHHSGHTSGHTSGPAQVKAGLSPPFGRLATGFARRALIDLRVPLELPPRSPKWLRSS